MRSTVLRVLLTALLVALTACTTEPPPRDAPPTPARVDRALRFAALAPLPAGAVVTRLDTESGIDTRVVLAIRLAEADAGPWRAASGLPPDDGQQRVANPDGAIVYRSAVAGAGEVTVTAFTT